MQYEEIAADRLQQASILIEKSGGLRSIRGEHLSRICGHRISGESEEIKMFLLRECDYHNHDPLAEIYGHDLHVSLYVA